MWAAQHLNPPHTSRESGTEGVVLENRVHLPLQKPQATPAPPAPWQPGHDQSLGLISSSPSGSLSLRKPTQSRDSGEFIVAAGAPTDTVPMSAPWPPDWTLPVAWFGLGFGSCLGSGHGHLLFCGTGELLKDLPRNCLITSANASWFLNFANKPLTKEPNLSDSSFTERLQGRHPPSKVC